MKKNLTILLTVPGPGIVRAFHLVKERKIRVIGTGPDKNAAGFFFVDKSYLVSKAADEKYIPQMLKICKKEKVDVLFPVAAWQLMKFARNIDLFEKIGTKVSISSVKSLEIVTNKERLYRACQKINVTTPKYYPAENLKEFKKAALKLSYPRQEICFKPAKSAGSRGFRVLSEKIDYLDLLLNKEGGLIYAKLKETLEILKRKKRFSKLLVMEYLSQEEYSVDCLADKGKMLIVVPRIREKVLGGGSVTGKSVYHRQIINDSKKISQALKLNGVFGLQFRADKKGKVKLLEVNPRFHGALIFTIGSGVHLPYLAAKLALGEKVKKPEIRWGTKTIRYNAEVYINPQGKMYELKEIKI